MCIDWLLQRLKSLKSCHCSMVIACTYCTLNVLFFSTGYFKIFSFSTGWMLLFLPWSSSYMSRPSQFDCSIIERWDKNSYYNIRHSHPYLVRVNDRHFVPDSFNCPYTVTSENFRTFRVRQKLNVWMAWALCGAKHSYTFTDHIRYPKDYHTSVP